MYDVSRKIAAIEECAAGDVQIRSHFLAPRDADAATSSEAQP
jgi:hypothetical protein